MKQFGCNELISSFSLGTFSKDKFEEFELLSEDYKISYSSSFIMIISLKLLTFELLAPAEYKLWLFFGILLGLGGFPSEL